MYRNTFMRTRLLLVGLLLLVLHALHTPCIASLVADAKKKSQMNTQNEPGLSDNIIRGPLLHEHSFAAPIVTDWWEEGVPHFMIGGSSVANEKFIRLTTNSLGDHGFAFNTAPCDHPAWEARLRFSIRPPLPAVRQQNRQQKGHPHPSPAVKYQGGEGMALWYLEHPLGDDHQHVPKYSKPIDPETAEKEAFREDPARMADLLLHQEDDDEDDAEEEEDEDEDEEEKVATNSNTNENTKRQTGGNETKREARRVERLMRQQEREARFRRVFHRGTSTDDSDLEPRVFGLKFSELRGFGVLLDSIGHHEKTDAHRNATGNPHAPHEPRITLLLNLPPPASGAGKPAVNNFSPSRSDFRASPVRLQCVYDFRQTHSHRAVHMTEEKDGDGNGDNQKDPAQTLLQRTPEEPVELIVRYYKRRLSVLISREDLSRRRVVANAVNKDDPSRDGGGRSPKHTHRLEKTFVDTLCGELGNVDLPQKYHFGVSASTGAKPKERRSKNKPDGPRGSVLQLFERQGDALRDLHVDVHDIYSFELRELGKDAKAMGYSKSIPIEHFDYEADKREREHFSRQLPVEPDKE